jgi:membrane protein DedA with SNARE-associated domain
VLLVHGSLTSGLVTFATHVINQLGLGGVLLLILCSGVIAIPGTEPTLLFAGFNVYEHHLSLIGVIVVAVIGDLIGATIAYLIGYIGQRELLERHGSKLHLSQAKLDRSYRWFDRWGAPTIFVSRILPFVRFAFSYVGGAARMSYPRFIVLSALGSIVWMTTWTLVGRAVGSQWQSWRHHLEYADYVFVALALIALAYLLLRWRRSVLVERAAATAPSTGAAGSEPRPPLAAEAADGDVGLRR